MAAVDNHLFAMWVEAPTSGVMQYCRVAEYNRNDAAPAWNFIDNGPVTGGGLNYDPSRIVGSPYNSITLTPFQSRLYAGWVEYDSISGADQFRVAVYDPALPLSGWKFVEHSPIDHNGINVDVNASASAPNLVAGGGALWAVWEETGAGPSQIRAARYNGNDSSPSWMPIDGGVPTIGINIMSSMQAVNPTAAFYDGHLVAAWIETGYLRAKAYDGNAWVEMDNAGYLNYDPAQSPNNLSMATSTGRLYLSWVENNTAVGTSLARVRAFNGDFSAPLWDFVDGAGDAGINTNVTYSASSPRLVDFNGGLVAIVKEFNGTASQIRVRAFNGDTGSPQWTTIDNGSSSGLNYIVSREAYSAAAVNFQGRLYLSWPETSSGALVEERVIRGM
jgi:hypothetical protein